MDSAIPKGQTAHARYIGLDTLRALAIAVVMLYHLTIFGELPSRIFPIAYYGWMGVDLFFVLSGFLIGQQALKPYLMGQHLSIAGFYKRRPSAFYLHILSFSRFTFWYPVGGSLHTSHRCGSS